MKESKMSRRNFLKAGALASAVGMMAAAPVAANAAAPTAVQAEDEENGMLDVFGKKPKYVFLFIGDGMGTAQIQSARFYQGTATNNGAVTEAELSFTQFPEVGSVTTYDSTSFCPDSASTATSIATGHKTESGVINMCPWTRDVPYETLPRSCTSREATKSASFPLSTSTTLPRQRSMPTRTAAKITTTSAWSWQTPALNTLQAASSRK